MTAPTPATMPSTTRPVSHGAQPMLSIHAPRFPQIHSPTRTSFVQSVAMVPMETGVPPMAMVYTAHMTTTKMGRARMRFVTIRSILSEAVSAYFAAFLRTERSTTRLM